MQSTNYAMPEHARIAEELSRYGYDTEEFNPACPNVIDIWHRNRALGFIEVTVCQYAEGHAVLCPVSYEDDDLIEVVGGDVSELVRQLDAFFNVCLNRE